MSFINLNSKEFKMSINGVSIEEYSIVVGVDKVSRGPIVVEPYVKTAYLQFQKYISLITGIVLPITTDCNPIVKKYEICIGNTNREKEKSEYEDEEYEIKTFEERLFINGGKRGLIYGVFSFLEKYCGVRFFAENVEKIKDAKEILINSINERYCPIFEYRDICFWNAFDTEFSVKNKINGLFIREIPESWGSGIGWVGGPSGLVHTFTGLVPYEKYYNEHPEYYALSEEGKREPSGLCLSESGTFKVALKTIKERLKNSNPSDIVSISINDGNVAYCNCPKCTKIKEIEGGESGNLIRFVNKISKTLKKDYPHVKVETLVYGKIREVPKKTKPLSDIVIRVCGSTVRSNSYLDFGKNKIYSENEQLKKAYARVTDWCKVAEKIYFWDYPAPYNVINSIFPHFHTLYDNTQFFLKNKVKGVFINGTTITTEFSALTVYLIAKLLYRPNMTKKEYEILFDEFLEGYYGKGWKYIKEFIEYTKVEGTTDKIFISTDEPCNMLRKVSDEKSRIEYMHGLFEKAYNETDSQAEKYRIKMDSLQVDYYEMFDLSDREYDTATKERKQWIEKRTKELYDNLKKYGILRVVENAFLPVVKDFSQSPKQWGLWEYDCTVGDRNNNNYSRDIYAIIKSDYPIGTRVSLKFKIKTNNNNEKTCACVYGNKRYEYIKVKGEKEKFVWKKYKNYTEVSVDDAVITNLPSYSEFENKDMKYSGYEFILPHEKGIIFKMEDIDAGAYFFIKDVIITTKE